MFVPRECVFAAAALLDQSLYMRMALSVFASSVLSAESINVTPRLTRSVKAVFMWAIALPWLRTVKYKKHAALSSCPHLTLKWNSSPHRLQPFSHLNKSESVIGVRLKFELRSFFQTQTQKTCTLEMSAHEKEDVRNVLKGAWKWQRFQKSSVRITSPLSTGVWIVPKSPAPGSMTARAKN